ncbi:hypothetical protein RhiXN_04289 [Rhizoctonia solani]|uniref:Uncharacterized protein n=2 Tax=Rhizoctonia solani TaxID=456999 RepID=A0A8H8STQ1_9AGAM|nr:uncharacterized protein RhiXN_04289 [Rhizoctonia solani]QRW16288.1 hypothetical protein RhiXN_04289 [Rhizoctonia solani]
MNPEQNAINLKYEISCLVVMNWMKAILIKLGGFLVHDDPQTPTTLVMPPRAAAPTTLVLRVKSHRTSVFVTVPSTATVVALKELVQKALNAHQEAESERGLPLPIEDSDDFILALRRPAGVNKRPGFIDIPEDDTSISLLELDVKNWDAVYIRWRVDGVYRPVEVTLPSLLDPTTEDDDVAEEQESEAEAPTRSKDKGKGKA